MRRRSIIGTSLAVVTAMSLTACGGDDGGEGSKTVRVTLVNHVWTENIKKALPEFEKQSGLKVEVTQLGEDQLSDQYNVKLNAGSTDLDVMMYRPLQEGKQFGKNKYLADLSERVKSDSAFEFGDFQAGPVQATTYEDKVVGLPIITEQEVLYYRKDLLAKSGFTAPPKSLDELKAQAAKVEADNPGVAGFVARTGKAAAVTQFSSFLFSFGGDFVDSQRKGHCQHRAGQAGVRLLRRPAPGPRPGEHQHRHELVGGDGDLHAGQGRLLHRGQLALQERHRPDQVQGRRHRRLRRRSRPARPGRSRTTSPPGRSA